MAQDKRLEMDTGLSKPRGIRFTDREWAAAEAYGEHSQGGMKPGNVVRKVLREFLRRHKYL